MYRGVFKTSVKHLTRSFSIVSKIFLDVERVVNTSMMHVV